MRARRLVAAHQAAQEAPGRRRVADAKNEVTDRRHRVAAEDETLDVGEIYFSHLLDSSQLPLLLRISSTVKVGYAL